MWIPIDGKRMLSVIWIIGCMTMPVWAQSKKVQAKTDSQTSSNVSAEMVKGKLNPSTSKPGDQVAVRLNDDVRSNGEVLIKKGTTLTGVVKNVKRIDSKSKTDAQSMMEIEWLTPGSGGAAAQNLNFALQSLAYTNPLFAQQQQQESSTSSADAAAPLPRPAPAASSGGSSRQGGGLLGGVAGGATSTVGAVSSVATSTTSTVGSVGGLGTSVAGNSTTGISGISGGSILPTDASTASALHNNFGVSNDSLFMTGHGQVISAGGSRDGVDLFSHMSNDTVITSPSKNFEVSSGAQMQFLVGTKKQ